MTPTLTTKPTATRQALLDAVASVRETLQANIAESEAQGTLTPASVNALRDAGLFRIKLPAVLGGGEIDPLLQMEVIEAVARIYPSAGWCVMIGGGSLAIAGAMLPDPAVKQIFADAKIPLAATCITPKGQAIPVAGATG